MTLSFKMIRNLGLLTMVAIIVMIGLSSFINTAKIIKSLSEVLREKRPVLERANSIREDFLNAKDIFTAFTREEVQNIDQAIALMNAAIEQSAALKKMVAENDKGEVNKFITAAKRFKIAVSAYADEYKSDPTGATAIGMEALALTTVKEASDALGKMINDIRAEIRAADINAYIIAKRSQNLILISVLVAAAAGLLIAFFMGKALMRPIRQLVEATQHIAQGDLTYKIQVNTKDELGQLSSAFNQMTDTLTQNIASRNELNKEIAERKKAEEILSQINQDLLISRDMLGKEKEKLKTTLRSIGDGVIATDMEGKVVLINEVACHLTGWKMEEAFGVPIGEVFHIVNEKTRERCENPVEKALQKKGIISLANDTVLISRDGTERIILDSGSPIWDTKGDIQGVVLVFRDNTEHRKVELAIRKLSRAVEFSPISLFITDSKGMIEYVNPKFLEITGYSRDEIVGSMPRILRPDKLPPEEHRRLWEAISSGKEWRGEFLNKKKNGEAYWEFVSIASIKDSQSKITNFLIVLEDITQRKLIAERLEEEKKTLEIFNKSAVNQEIDAIALKKEVNELLKKNGLPVKYTEVDEIERIINIEKEKENKS